MENPYAKLIRADEGPWDIRVASARGLLDYAAKKLRAGDGLEPALADYLAAAFEDIVSGKSEPAHAMNLKKVGPPDKDLRDRNVAGWYRELVNEYGEKKWLARE